MALRTSLPVQPHLYIGDVTGVPLDYGMVYFGEPNKDPEFYPIDIYYDEAMTVAAAQPVRTKGGFMNAFGDMVEVYADEQTYSVKVVDAYGYKVFYKPEMSKTSTGTSVSTKQPFANAVVRTQDEKNAETVSVKDFGAIGDGVADDTSAIQKALDYARANNTTLLFPSGNYNASGNLTGYHSTTTDGDGVIKSGGNSWYVRPKKSQKNLIYVSPTGSATNDGFSKDTPTRLTTANSIARYYIGDKAADGVWGILMMSGTYSDNGITLEEWSIFKNPFEWHGETVASKTTAPTVIWDGSIGNINNYAILAQNISAYLNIEFKYIHFKNWYGSDINSPSGGAVVMWNKGEYHVEGCWFTKTRIGFSQRYSYSRVVDCKFDSCQAWAVSAAYQGTMMCGNLNTGGNLFIDCKEGANVGRGSIMYVQKNTFTRCEVDIYCAITSRIRPQGNTHTDWTSYAYSLSSGSVLTPDNNQGYPETYNNGNNKPIFYGESGSFHSTAHRGAVKTVNVSATGEAYTLNTGTPMSLLTTLFSNPYYVPFRIPSWTMLSPTYSLELKVNLYARAGYAGRIVLSGSGAAGGIAEIIGVDIPTVANNQWLQLIVEVYSREDIGSFIAFARIPELNITSKTAGTVNEYLGEHKDTTHAFRLYGSNTGTDTLAFYGLKSYVEL